MADDLGWGHLSCYGNNDFSTPALDRLARGGVRLTHAYANSCVCSPTRMALMTGRYQYRLKGGLEEPIKEQPSAVLGLPPAHPTLPSMLRTAGYRTALVGKWHLGYLPHFGPLKSGYDEFYGITSGGADYFTHKNRSGKENLYEGERLVDEQGYLTDLLTTRAVRYIDNAAAAQQPFFLSLHYTAPHWPWETARDQKRASELKDLFDLGGGSLETYGAMVQSLDQGVGAVLDTLKRNRLASDTIVIFTSDNGGERFSRNWPLVGEKGDLLEGGIRVPALIRYPRTIAPGQVSAQVAVTMDWVPTLLALAGAKAELPLDGMDILPMLGRPSAEVPRRLYWRFVGRAQAAVRDGPLKYLRVGQHAYLFNIPDDPRERANLAEARPQQVEQLRTGFNEWNRTMLPDTGVVGFVFGPDKLAGKPE